VILTTDVKGGTVPSSWRSLRRRILTPDESETSLTTRGFTPKNAAAQERLERIGRTFLTGYAAAAQARDPLDAEADLEAVEAGYRGFAYEGAAMALAVLDGLHPGRARRVRHFLTGRAAAHTYMVHVGVGWAFGRLPRWRWRAVLPPDPLLRWLALDGYGFHQAYFHTQRYVREQYRGRLDGWPGDGTAAYAPHAVDQGIGRALWFVEGTDTDRVAATIEGFAADRRDDLYSGAGLAATYAGGATDAELRSLCARAAAYRPALAQGSAFAAQARLRAGLVVPHVERATAVLCGASVAEAAALTQSALPPDDLPGPAQTPAYALWRARIAGEFMSLGRC
jgi:hypothetical protein